MRLEVEVRVGLRRRGLAGSRSMLGYGEDGDGKVEVVADGEDCEPFFERGGERPRDAGLL